MKITIEIDDHTATVENKDAVSLTEALVLMDQVLKGAGFSYKGELDIVEEGTNNV